MADALWDASRSGEPAILTVLHEGSLINFRLGIRSAEVTKHGPTEWRRGKQFTVSLGLVQLEEVQREAGE
ncbi:hypothetical protein CEQ23_22420 [Burkholderia cepacia]|uniref:Uncharacterized protein n=2 Tax=Burkholderia cepacia TaxID=292 RepID=A0ABN5D0J9_BURCE|nr:hypothetical protein APZ15_11890 [Burkholderia cepacia ATCC 25416]ASE96081.1 hypothetical protein CEQ23_22420 [Burkholderia cepacia]ATF78918.1 hypothetical protein CO711_16845 [Burkholderia cepacia]